MRSQYVLPIAIVVVGALVAGAVFLLSRGPGGGTQGGDGLPDIPAVTSADHIFGNPDAVIKVVEYADLECPFCKDFHVTMHQIMDYYGPSGKVAWVFRNFPLAQIHSKAPTEAQAAECAADQGGSEGFFKFIDKVYEVTPGSNGLDLSKLPQLATDVGLDGDALSQCLSSNTHRDKVQAQYSEAIRAGLQGTPAIIIMANNEVVISLSGAQPYASMRQAIDETLAGLGESVTPTESQ